MIANILALLLLICGANSTYNASMAKNLAYVCACTFATAEEINNWTCKYCVYNNLTNVHNVSTRPKHLIIQSQMCLASPHTPLLMMLSL